MTASCFPMSRIATLALLAAAVSFVGACSDDDPSSPAPVVIGGGPMSPDDGVQGTMDGGEPDATDDGEPGMTEDVVTGQVDAPEIPPGRDDRPGLAVRFPGDRNPDALSSPWLAIVNVFQIAPRPESTGGLYVRLLRYDDGLAFFDHADFYTGELDTCDIRFPEESADGDGDGDGNRPPRVSGGEAVTLSSAGAPWASVPFSPESGEYDGDDVFPAAMPDDLTLSLPGAAFPAIDALPLFVPDAPERLSPNFDETVTGATEYRWVPGDDGAFVQIVFLRFVDGAFAGFPISCDVVDDGAFELPDDAVAALAAMPGTTTVRYTRRLRRIDFRDGVAVLRRVTIADD